MRVDGGGGREAVGLNTAETDESEVQAVAGRLFDGGRIERVGSAALRQPEPVLKVVTRPHVAAIVLAAGGSRRMGGRPKQLLPIGGRPMLRRVLDAVRAAPVDGTVVVLGYGAGDVKRGLRIAGRLQIADCRVVVKERWAEGLRRSVSVGLDAISPAADVGALTKSSVGLMGRPSACSTSKYGAMSVGPAAVTLGKVDRTSLTTK